MRSLLTSRLFHCVVCLLLICCVLVQISPLKVRATSAVVPIVKAATVTGNPYVIVGAALIALGVMVGTETGAFETVVDNAVSFLDTAGGWIENGTMQLLQTVDSTGQAMYYAAGDLLETLRGWLFDSSVIESVSVPLSSTIIYGSSTYEFSKPVTLVCFTYDHPQASQYTYFRYFVICSEYFYRLNSSAYSSQQGNYYVYYLGEQSAWVGSSSYESNILYYQTYCGARYLGYYTMMETGATPWGDSDLLEYLSSTEDLSLGVVPTVSIDGTSAREWAPDYANKGLKVIEGGGGTDPDNDGSDGKWFLPLALTVTAAELYLMSQADEWSAVTPPEFADNVSTSTEFEILSTPEIDGYQGIEIQPVQDPAPDTGGDSGETPDPTTGGDTGTDPDTGGSSNPDAGQDPDTNPDADPDTNPDTDPDAGTDTGTDAWSPSGDMQHFTLDLKDYFPFCIPFDLYDFFTCLNADPVAPVIQWVIPLPGGETYPLELDLAVFDDVAQLLRRLQLLLFCVGLAFKTRDLIKG